MKDYNDDDLKEVREELFERKIVTSGSQDYKPAGEEGISDDDWIAQQEQLLKKQDEKKRAEEAAKKENIQKKANDAVSKLRNKMGLPPVGE